MLTQSLNEKSVNCPDAFFFCEQCGRCASACPITDIKGFNIRRILRYVELGYESKVEKTALPWQCTTCGRCEDACPNDIPILQLTRSLRRNAPEKHIPESAPCTAACPAGIDIPQYLRWISKGESQKAFEVIMEKAPFPGILGRICHHPCEDHCRRKAVNAPIAICSAKRWVADQMVSIKKSTEKTCPGTHPPVAIIGAGPSGLTAAYFLRKKGHPVTIFEARNKPGGMLRYGIPEYRLPERIVAGEIQRILSEDIQLETRMALGRELDIDSLKESGFKSVYIATGAQSSKKIDIEGIRLEGVLWGVDFLIEAQKKIPFKVAKETLVIGGGNVAIDVALTAKRLGAKRVRLACLEDKSTMPANPSDIRLAEEEGIEMLFSFGPKKITGDGIKVTGAELIRCTSVFDDSGNFCPYFDEMRKEIHTDQVILAIGQTCETDFCKDFCLLEDQGGITVINGLIQIDERTFETSQPGVFAGGDVTKGPASVIEAIADGRKVAFAIHEHLTHQSVTPHEDKNEKHLSAAEYTGVRAKGFADLPRIDPERLPLPQRHHNFDEIERGLTRDQVMAESRRCLQCDLEILKALE